MFLSGTVHGHYSNAAFAKGLEAILQVLYEVNKYFQECEPWNLAKAKKNAPVADAETLEKNKKRLQDILYITYEAIRICSLLLQPIIPQKVAQAMDHFHIPKEHLNPMSYGYGYNYANMTGMSCTSNKSLILFMKPSTKNKISS